MTTRARAGLAAVALLLAAMLAGCGDDDDGDKGFADRSYDEIKKDALDAMSSLEAVHVQAQVVSEGQPSGVDLSMSSDGNCAGSVSFGAVSAEVLRADGDGWFKPSAELLAELYPDQTAAVTEFVGDSWVADAEGEVTAENCDLAGFIDQLSDDAPETNTKVAGVETLDGEEVVRIDYTNSEGDGSAYVRVGGDHYLVKIELEGDSPGTVVFSEFDEKVDTEAPAEDHVVDLAEFQP
jgi:hypothetical protein